MDRLYRTLAQYGKYTFKYRQDDDWTDRLNYVYTCILFVMCSIIISTRQYVGEVIVCWTPAQFTTTHNRYTNNICWVSNTYYLPPKVKQIPEDIKTRESRQIGYYQWVPFVLLIQAISFYVPNILVRAFTKQSAGLNVKALVKVASDVHNLNPDSRAKTIRYISRHIEHCLDSQREYRSGALVRLRHMLARTCCIFVGERYGNKLACCYLLTKAIYLANSLGNLIYLNIFLQTDYSFYGLEVLLDLMRGDDWQQSGRFPRVTMCDFEIRALGNVHRHTVQCVLPINMFNEKMFIFAWFWLLLLFLATLGSTFHWLGLLIFRRGRIKYIRKHLKITNKIDPKDGKILERFVLLYLRVDRVFVLHLLGKNAGNMVVSEIVESMWQSYKIRTSIAINNTLSKPESSPLTAGPINDTDTSPKPPINPTAPPDYELDIFAGNSSKVGRKNKKYRIGKGAKDIAAQKLVDGKKDRSGVENTANHF